nr:YigZ family protein [Leuconostoc lactis]
MDKYITIAPDQFVWEQDIKKSRFILNIARISSEEDARAFIEKINKQHYKATHNVFAYLLGDNDQIQRYSDNGEPSGTAGVPVAEVELPEFQATLTDFLAGNIKFQIGEKTFFEISTK